MAGIMGVPYSASYAATKAAVVSMTGSWAVELKRHNIHVSALCPAFVQTKIHESVRNKQDKYKSEKKAVPFNAKEKERFKQSVGQAAALVESGIPTELLAKRAVEALNSGQTYIFSHPNYREIASYRAAMIDKAFDDAQESDLVKHLIDDDVVSL
jgi:short-subunit dehydrogenase